MKKRFVFISEKEAKFILGDDEGWDIFYHNYPCNNCDDAYRNELPMVVEKFELNDLNDLIFRGKCGRCGGKSNRYLETGETEDSYARAEEIRGKLGIK